MKGVERYMNFKLLKKTVIIFTIISVIPMISSCSTSRRNIPDLNFTLSSELQYDIESRRIIFEELAAEAEMREPVSVIFQEPIWLANIFRYKDITIKLPAGWEKATDEDMEQLLTFFDKPDIKFGMFAEDPVTEDNIILVIQDLTVVSPEQIELLDEKTFLTLMMPGLGNKEGEILDSEIKEVILGGKTYTYLTEITESSEISFIQHYAVRKIENEMIALIFTCDPGVLLEDFAADIFL